LIYTSGTTGPPKGVELTHANMVSELRGLDAVWPQPARGRAVSFLPAAHVADRTLSHYGPMAYGTTITSCPDAAQLFSYLPEVRPTLMGGVPRIWEKLKAALEAGFAGEQDPARREAIEQAIETGRRCVRLEQEGEEVPADLAEARAAAERAVFAPLRERLGLDEVAVWVVGAAATPTDVMEFFFALGCPLAEVWGMSELSCVATWNPPGRSRIGTVGPPIPGCELRIAEDGEVLVRGPLVMKGYRNRPEMTAETIDGDGWLHTGDVGEIDADGYLRIVDRKKELIINAAGKNMSPANIEGEIKGSSQLIGQAVCVGDGRPYNVALIVLDPDVAPVFASQHGIANGTLAALAADATVRAEVAAGIERANARLSRVEQIKRFAILPVDWQPAGDELTPTMKLKRKPIAQKYADEIEALYQG
jgi:long-subunit acyl-CoA synthetase (AMP-forming)